jgi:DNA invertase Pin-like site-specific DNA recombinase
MKKLRCAVYTRKSTEEGLEQEFNSLHAQREACEAYIKSQQHEGWRLVRDHYDDGGYSGGSMDRPALTRLLDAIKEGLVDVVVVYKVDRLTRSLADFARMVELFDKSGVSFVSVTQQFNTTTSMGRLTLNVLLSFAQFEREVTGERIRDKIAASKKKGLWMGGPVPLGYDVRDKRLIINPHEAETVRAIFTLYTELGTVRRLKETVDQRNLTTKRRGDAPGKPFTRGHLYQLLGNPLYVGEVVHRGATHPGQHDAIIDRSTWEAVQSQLKANKVAERSKKNTKTISPLAGLLYDETGDRLCPTHANKKGRRYRYYISRRLAHDAHKYDGGWRLPAKEIETVVTGALADFLKDALRVLEGLRMHAASPTEAHQATKRASGTAEHLLRSAPGEQRERLAVLVTRINLAPSAVLIDVSRSGLSRLVLGRDTQHSDAPDETVQLHIPIRLRRRGVEAKLVIADPARRRREIDPRLTRLVAEAHLWLAQLAAGEFPSVRAIADRYGMHEADVSRSLTLAFLAPDIVNSILDGSHPADLTAEGLRRQPNLPMDWKVQRRLLGVAR